MLANSEEIARVASELAAAHAARAEGNEGKARVCARRAAGWAVGYYRRSLGEDIHRVSAYKHLDWLMRLDTASAATRATASHLTERIDFNHELRSGADALVEARRLIAEFLPEALAD